MIKYYMVITMSKYFDKLMNFKDKTFKEQALIDGVPIIKDESLKLLIFLLKFINAKRVLEIGTAVGFSAVNMALEAGVIVDTIEKDKKMYNNALKNVSDNKLENKINVYNYDALEFPISLIENNKYDLIFIDAAKAQYQKFFEKYESLLADGGIIVSDNLLFHGFVDAYDENIEIEGSRNLKALVRKIDRFNKWLLNNDEYDTTFLDIGDGIAISKKVNK